MTDTGPSQRIAALDLLRSAALLGMASYHFVYDLQMHGLVPPGFAVQGFFYWHARTVASTFLMLAGLGIWLAHGRGIRWPAFWRRLAKVGGAAALVSV
ncbi:MAG TPA: heparan-alpha-glucosaminide N-acetyltransferase domain-containing protein, partial [Tabrizicola sp.]|nr:heparan-alpha-glucosaminide N-acetyltransferase domain-containing protein [Tabrizicola sp.]